MEIRVITNRCFGLFMRRNVSISRKRTKERLLDWKEFPSKSVGRFSFQCLTVYENVVVMHSKFHHGVISYRGVIALCLRKFL